MSRVGRLLLRVKAPRSLRHFRALCGTPVQAQDRLLREILVTNAGTEFGRTATHGAQRMLPAAAEQPSTQIAPPSRLLFCLAQNHGCLEVVMCPMRDVDNFEPTAPALVDVVRVHEHIAVVFDRVRIRRIDEASLRHRLPRPESFIELGMPLQSLE